MYSILHAPKTDGAEALVLSASWYSRNRDKMTGERKVNERGIAIVLALANYLKSEFVVVDSSAAFLSNSRY